MKVESVGPRRSVSDKCITFLTGSGEVRCVGKGEDATAAPPDRSFLEKVQQETKEVGEEGHGEV